MRLISHFPLLLEQGGGGGDISMSVTSACDASICDIIKIDACKVIVEEKSRRRVGCCLYECFEERRRKGGKREDA